jgi:Zn-dependent protease
MVWVAAAGPGMNILLATVSAALLSLYVHAQIGSSGFPVQLLLASIQINLILAIFNMIPIPPLDGGRVAVGLLPMPLAKPLAQVGQFGLLPILLILLVLPRLGVNVIGWLVGGPVHFIGQWILGLFGLRGG